jgi:hypothetical protein
MSELALEHKELEEELEEEVIEEEVDLGYRPRDPQLIIHNAVEEHRFNVVVAHRRMGKTVSAINQLIHSALNCDKPNPRFAYIAPTYNQAKRVAWDYLLEYTRPLDAKVNIAELRVDFWMDVEFLYTVLIMLILFVESILMG